MTILSSLPGSDRQIWRQRNSQILTLVYVYMKMMISHLVIKHLACNSRCLLFVCVFAFLMCLLVRKGLEEQTTKYLYTCLNICVGIDFKIKSVYVIRGLNIFGLIFSLACWLWAVCIWHFLSCAKLMHCLWFLDEYRFVSLCSLDEPSGSVWLWF